MNIYCIFLTGLLACTTMYGTKGRASLNNRHTKALLRYRTSLANALQDSLQCSAIHRTDSRMTEFQQSALWTTLETENIPALYDQLLFNDFSQTDREGWTPLAFAVWQKKNIAMGRMLLESLAADPNQILTLYSRGTLLKSETTLLDFLIEQGYVEGVELLLAYKASRPDPEGVTMLRLQQTIEQCNRLFNYKKQREPYFNQNSCDNTHACIYEKYTLIAHMLSEHFINQQ